MGKRVLFLSCLLLPFLADAQLFRSSNYWRQYRNELSIGVGAANTLSELGGRDQVGSDFIYDLEMSQTSYALSLNYRYFIKKQIALRGSFTYAKVSGDDKLTKDQFRRARNLNFTSPIMEGAVIGEFHLANERAGSRYKLKGAKGKRHLAVGIYVFAGIGGFYYDPRIKGTSTRLKPLHTEGQGLDGGPKQYSNFAVAVPMGLGLRYSINTQWRIGLEGGYRFTTTDYLDDVSGDYYNKKDLIDAYGQEAWEAADPSLEYNFEKGGDQRGDPTDRDGYMFAQLQIIYKMTKKKKYGRGSRIKSRRSMPSF